MTATRKLRAEVVDLVQPIDNLLDNPKTAVVEPDNCLQNQALSESDVFLSVLEVANLLGCSKQAVQKKIRKGNFVTRIDEADKRKPVFVALSSLPASAREKWLRENTPPNDAEADTRRLDALSYQQAADYNRRKADKYALLFQATDGLKGAGLREAIQKWNAAHPEQKTSYPSLMRARKIFAEEGLSGLLGSYGKLRGTSKIDDPCWGEAMPPVYEFFKSAYLKRSQPKLEAVFAATLGFAKEHGFFEAVRQGRFPSRAAFLRKLKKEIGEAAICLHREGEEAYNRKYAHFLSRDYSAIRAGKVWVSDHRRLDQAWALADGRARRPWLTVWRDFKTGYWISWSLHFEDPNADHVIETFCEACLKIGVPEEIIIDNGKDYRVKDFAGGRRRFRPNYANQDAADYNYIRTQSRSLTAQLGVRVHFANPYGAQTKPIERDFLIFKEWMDKGMPGYTGGNPLERPERVEAQLDFERGEALVGYFIEEVLHQIKSQGKVLSGRSREAAWREEYDGAAAKWVTEDALRLYRYRISGEVTIKRNGVRDAALGDWYYAEWMDGHAGAKVYLRRSLKAWQEAWVFDAETDEYLGPATLGFWRVPALAESGLERKTVREKLAHKKRVKKTLKTLAGDGVEVSPEALLRYQSAGVQAGASLSETLAAEAQHANDKQQGKIKSIGQNGSAKIIHKTAMDEALSREREWRKTGTHDIACFSPATDEPPAKKRYSIFKCDLEDEE
ncbi:hypothetical protein Ctha_0284 [Chloroherpeton thalassium ATCC 35110]|uniref:Integrase catalytic domain-containing protein n=1 Tax=Chloroherpeton thalassium (strain ATCC 35110 / GB-78) TaxID=517418 RepID=B3QTK9_CHLT3|nr:DNA-binding domain-containing protein [Chloroherpeton thalassium]ACF12755.1 hypothetical protein Ctha_0284 [Chloroherpeton thalassium ATCC 35110]